MNDGERERVALMEEERRHGRMDDVAKAIGSLEATVAAVAKRQDSIQLERQIQHSEALRDSTDVKAQIHEIKHTQSNDAVKMQQIIGRLDQHQQFATEGIERLHQEIIANRVAAEARDDKMNARLDDISAWRWYVRGAWAVVGLALVVWGQDIWAAVVSFVRLRGGRG